MDTKEELSENTRRGFAAEKGKGLPGLMEAKPNKATGMRVVLRRNGIGSRCITIERDTTIPRLGSSSVKIPSGSKVGLISTHMWGTIQSMPLIRKD
jgi:hypothetical protein